MSDGRTLKRGTPRTGGPDRRATRAWALACLLAGAAQVCHAEVTIEPGDTLRIAVLEAPEYGRDAPVGVDGTILLPGLGAIEVEGQGLLAVRDRIEEALREQGLLRTPTVLVDFASYRPFYVGGAVAKPGAVAFEPSLTVRHALILAGGVGRTGPADPQPPSSSQVTALRAQFRASSFALFQTDSLIARLTAELDRTASVTPPRLDPDLASSEDAQALVSTDDDLLQDRLVSWTDETSHLQTSLDLVLSEIGILEQQAKLQEGEQQIQQAEVENARSLVDRGVMSRSQLQELERESSRLSRDVLENQAYAARARQERAAAEHQIAAADTDWRISLREQIRTALVERARLRTELDSLTEQLADLGTQIDAAGRVVAPEIEVVIYRAGENGTERMEADLDTSIQPGDVLEVALVRSSGGTG